LPAGVPSRLNKEFAMSGMQKIFRPRFVMLLVAVLSIWGLLRAYRFHAVDEATALASDKSDPAKEDDADALSNEKLYQLPKTDDVDELMAYIKRLRTFRPKSREELMLHRKSVGPAIKAAAERIVKVEKDTTSEAYRTASSLLLAVRVAAIPESTPAERQAIIADVAVRLSARPPVRDDVAVAMLLAHNLEQMDLDRLAAEANRNFAKALGGAQDEEIAAVAAHFAAVARRLDLVGNPMLVYGPTVSGKPFDWQSYRGKVVLVDFWATWCGPCLEELPNVLRAYRAYHDRGFDVVGVSTDSDDEKLDEFLAKNKLPWVTLRTKPQEEKAGPDTQSLAEFYSVESIPTVILVGKDGKVVSLQARGKELWRLLADLLGPPPAGTEPAGKPAESSVDDGSAAGAAQPGAEPKAAASKSPAK
jgi:thiol-disulfide isomerase/thioredoxin